MERVNRKALIFCSIVIFSLVIGMIYVKYTNPTRQNRIFGVTYMTMNNPYYEVINNELLKVIEDNGDQLLVRDPALDVDKQIEQIYNFIDADVDGIFVNPIESSGLEEVLQAARDAGIPVIIIDAPVDNSELVNCTIVSDNYDAGVQCANDMMQRMDSANIILLKHSAVQSASDRIQGFLDTIEGNSNYQIINEGECEGQLEQAMPLMQSMLEETSDVDVVMALNDPSALGALAALESKGYSDVIVYGVDGTPELKQLINQSSMVAGTVAQSPITTGQIAAEKMYNIMNHQSIESEIIIPVTLINKNNINEYDETGWQ
ncbi:MAG: sugar ABC transporter substrate-binding protein [Erysipelotrichaceae bacterium]|nr:sugar ABC transporter substrate-binding protein [Erysipelotrichaceae bacterium]